MSTVKVKRLSGPARRGELPYLFSYDIRCRKRAHHVLKYLRQWRVAGQLSVHETWLRAWELETVAAELMELVDQDSDRLLVARLSRQGRGPVYRLTDRASHSPVKGSGWTSVLPKQLQGGWYLLAYDVSDPKRLRRVQRVTAKQTVFLQRSVYLYQGNGAVLSGLLQRIQSVLRSTEDDLRIYRLSGPANLWFMCGEMPPLGGLQQQRSHSILNRIKQFFRLA